VTRGKFIVVEGGEGTGKSVLSSGLAAWLRLHGKAVVQTREPGGTPSAVRIREVFARPETSDPLTMEAEALLVSAARAQHVARLVEPALARGEWVVCDRFTDSTRVYQGSVGGCDGAALEQLIFFSTKGLVPDLTILLDCPPAVAAARAAGRNAEHGSSAKGEAAGHVERYDRAGESFYDKIRGSFLALAAARGEAGMAVISSAQDQEKVLADVVARVQKQWPAELQGQEAR
jgi:dTMP kinase